MPLLASLSFGYFPALLFAYLLIWVDRYEKEPVMLLGVVFIWGAIVAACGAFIINTVLGLGIFIFTNSEVATDIATGSLIAPIVEEILKGIAVLGVFFIFQKEFDSVLDGVIYAGVTALGFAATENSYYIYSYGFIDSGWQGFWKLVFVRVILVGLQHPFYTAFTGIGLAISRLNRNLVIKIGAPLLGISIAMFTHAFHNTLGSILSGFSGLVIGTLFDWTGWFFMLCFLVWAIFKEKQTMRIYLLEEVEQGHINSYQYRIAISVFAQIQVKFLALFKGSYHSTRRFFQLCGEIAHKRSQFINLGDENGNLPIIQSIQVELARLSPFIH